MIKKRFGARPDNFVSKQIRIDPSYLQGSFSTSYVMIGMADLLLDTLSTAS